MQCHHHNYITAPKDGPVDDESTVSCKDDSSPVSICALEFLRGNTWGLGTNLKHSKQTNCFGKGESTSECIKQTQPQFSKTNEGHTTGHTQVDESKRASVDHTRSFNRTEHNTAEANKTLVSTSNGETTDDGHCDDDSDPCHDFCHAYDGHGHYRDVVPYSFVYFRGSCFGFDFGDGHGARVSFLFHSAGSYRAAVPYVYDVKLFDTQPRHLPSPLVLLSRQPHQARSEPCEPAISIANVLSMVSGDHCCDFESATCSFD
jgi:hypothetical protein